MRTIKKYDSTAIVLKNINMNFFSNKISYLCLYYSRRLQNGVAILTTKTEKEKWKKNKRKRRMRGPLACRRKKNRQLLILLGESRTGIKEPCSDKRYSTSDNISSSLRSPRLRCFHGLIGPLLFLLFP